MLGYDDGMRLKMFSDGVGLKIGTRVNKFNVFSTQKILNIS